MNGKEKNLLSIVEFVVCFVHKVKRIGIVVVSFFYRQRVVCVQSKTSWIEKKPALTKKNIEKIAHSKADWWDQFEFVATAHTNTATTSVLHNGFNVAQNEIHTYSIFPMKKTFHITFIFGILFYSFLHFRSYKIHFFCFISYSFRLFYSVILNIFFSLLLLDYFFHV